MLVFFTDILLSYILVFYLIFQRIQSLTVIMQDELFRLISFFFVYLDGEWNLENDGLFYLHFFWCWLIFVADPTSWDKGCLLLFLLKHFLFCIFSENDVLNFLSVSYLFRSWCPFMFLNLISGSIPTCCWGGKI